MKPSSSNENQFQLESNSEQKKLDWKRDDVFLNWWWAHSKWEEGNLKKTHWNGPKRRQLSLIFCLFFLFFFFSACRARRTFLGRSFIVVRFHYTFPYDGCHANAVAMATAAQWHRFIFFLSLFFSLVRAFKGLAAGADYSSMGCDLKKKPHQPPDCSPTETHFDIQGFLT